MSEPLTAEQQTLAGPELTATPGIESDPMAPLLTSTPSMSATIAVLPQARTLGIPIGAYAVDPGTPNESQHSVDSRPSYDWDRTMPLVGFDEALRAQPLTAPIESPGPDTSDDIVDWSGELGSTDGLADILGELDALPDEAIPAPLHAGA
jgi:hypothetical protein